MIARVALAIVIASAAACPTSEPVGEVQRELELSDDDLDVTSPADDGAERERFLAECAGGDVPAVPPTPPSAPIVTDVMPPACDRAARIAAVIDACGPIDDVAFTTLSALSSSCGGGRTCRTTLPAGTFAGDATLGCVVIEGQGDDTIVDGWLSFHRPSVASRLLVTGEYNAIAASADVLLDEVTLIGGYEAVGVAWDQDLSLAVCRSRVAGGYSGVALAWGSKGAVVAATSIAACYEGLALSYGSSELHATRNVVYGGYSAVHVHQSTNVAVLGNVLFSPELAVDVFSGSTGASDPQYTPPSANVLIRRNHVVSGALPENDPEHGIVVEDND